MNSTADFVLKQCESYIASGDIPNARKCAAGLSILTGQPAWERAYRFLIDDEHPEDFLGFRLYSLPENLPQTLHDLHDERGEIFPHQSVRKGTQVNLTHHELKDWLETLTQREIIGLWTTRLNQGGYHIPHIHPRGENSHVLYVESPSDYSGQLYFGVSRYSKKPPKTFVRAQDGLMVSFPCWLWHGVTEYLGEKPRLALAFDTHG